MHEKGAVITTDVNIAEILNNRFGTVFTSENISNVPEFSLFYWKNIEAPMSYFRIDEQVISKWIANLKLSNCPGPDEISPRILKRAVDSTNKALSLIFNRSLLHGKIPGDWKSANVVHIFKKCSKGDNNNYSKGVAPDQGGRG